MEQKEKDYINQLAWRIQQLEFQLATVCNRLGIGVPDFNPAPQKQSDERRGDVGMGPLLNSNSDFV